MLNHSSLIRLAPPRHLESGLNSLAMIINYDVRYQGFAYGYLTSRPAHTWSAVFGNTITVCTAKTTCKASTRTNTKRNTCNSK